MILVQSRFFLQSLVLGWWWPTDLKITRQEALERLDDEIFNFDNNEMPNPNQYALMARFVVHNSNWTAVAYLSHQKQSEGRALADMFSVSDGLVSKGTGIPYIYVSRLQAAVSDVLDHDGQASLVMSLAETDICRNLNWDPEDPRCAHVSLTGTISVVSKDSAEYNSALEGVFERHPSFRTLPTNHGFFLAKFTIKSITLQDSFGGPVDVSLRDYFNIKSKRFGLVAAHSDNYIKNYLDLIDSYEVQQIESNYV